MNAPGFLHRGFTWCVGSSESGLLPLRDSTPQLPMGTSNHHGFSFIVDPMVSPIFRHIFVLQWCQGGESLAKAGFMAALQHQMRKLDSGAEEQKAKVRGLVLVGGAPQLCLLVYNRHEVWIYHDISIINPNLLSGEVEIPTN